MFNQNRIYRVFRLINLLKSSPTKSIKRLAESMDVSERSLYRYIDLLAEVGFDVQKDSLNRYYLKHDNIEPFTKEEAELINQSITSNHKANPLIRSIRAKLESLGELNAASNEIVSSHYSKIISRIKEALEAKCQLLLVKYQSASTESVSDRLVEPVGFTTNYQYLCAYEVESKLNKYFKIDRIGAIEILSEMVKFQKEHKLLDHDVFGFNESGERFYVKLKLSMRAKLFLKDDYPATTEFLKEQSDGSWLLEVEVNSMDPVERIVRSMPGEVELID
jgi:predicted DNA-binding transcriptional regulator YafY